MILVMIDRVDAEPEMMVIPSFLHSLTLYANALIPVIACPMTSVCTSSVPS